MKAQMGSCPQATGEVLVHWESLLVAAQGVGVGRCLLQSWHFLAAGLEEWCVSPGQVAEFPRSLRGQWGVQWGAVPWHHHSARAPGLSLQQNVVGTWEMGTTECNLCFKEVLSFSFIPSWPLILKLAGECDFPAWPIALPGSELFSVALGILHPVPT